MKVWSFWFCPLPPSSGFSLPPAPHLAPAAPTHWAAFSWLQSGAATSQVAPPFFPHALTLYTHVNKPHHTQPNILSVLIPVKKKSNGSTNPHHLGTPCAHIYTKCAYMLSQKPSWPGAAARVDLRLIPPRQKPHPCPRPCPRFRPSKQNQPRNLVPVQVLKPNPTLSFGTHQYKPLWGRVKNQPHP